MIKLNTIELNTFRVPTGMNSNMIELNLLGYELISAKPQHFEYRYKLTYDRAQHFRSMSSINSLGV